MMANLSAWITQDERPTCGEADAPIWRGRRAGRLKVLPVGLGADVLSPLTVNEETTLVWLHHLYI